MCRTSIAAAALVLAVETAAADASADAEADKDADAEPKAASPCEMAARLTNIALSKVGLAK